MSDTSRIREVKRAAQQTVPAKPFLAALEAP